MEGNMKKSKQYCEAGNKATIESKSKIQIFEAGYDFAMSQPKHIFDGAAVAGEVRRFEGYLVDVVANDAKNSCMVCCLDYCADTIACQHNTGCDTHNVKYIKRV